MKRAGMTNLVLSVVMMFVLVFALAGCGTSSAERIAAVKNYVSQAQQIALEIDGKLGQVSETIAQFQTALAETNADDPMTGAIVEGLAKAQETQVKLNEQKTVVLATLANLNATLAGIEAGGADWVDEINLLAAGGASVGTSVGGETGGKIAVGATLLGLLAGLLRTWKQKKTAEQMVANATSNLATVVRSVDAALSTVGDDSGKLIKEQLWKIQGPAVTAAVKTVKAT